MSQDEYFSLCLMAFAAARQAGARGRNRGHGAPPLFASAASSEPVNFRCALCGKAFASYQALGGHMASHRKPDAGAPAHKGMVPSLPQNEGAVPSAAGGGGRHACTVCHRGFATGQALGGHKRFHYLHGPSVSASLASAAVSSMRGFDLNLAPMGTEITSAQTRREDEDDEEVQSPTLTAKKPRRHSNSSTLKRSRPESRKSTHHKEEGR